MATVNTVLGPIEASELGFTLSHEHVMSSSGRDRFVYPWLYDAARSIDLAVSRMQEAKAEGIDSVIDLTTPDLGRDVEVMRECSRRSGVHVIPATGIWRDVPRPFQTRDVEETTSIFVREIEEGIGTTDIRAGVIKVANDVEGFTEGHLRVARAAARASAQTGCPISTHHWAPERIGLEQIRIFKAEGAQMDRVCIGHSADSTDVDYLEEMLNQGVYLSMDRYPGREGRPGWKERNATVKALIDRGWASKLMLGHDVGPTPWLKVGEQEAPPAYNPDGWLFLSRVALPALIEDGVPSETVDLMMREVPRRFLTGED